MIPRSAIAADLDALAGAWAWTPADTLVHGLPLFHVHGLVLGCWARCGPDPGSYTLAARHRPTTRPRPAG